MLTSSVPPWCNGNTTGFELVILGSIPSGGAKQKHIAEVGSVRQGDPIAYVVSVFLFGSSTGERNETKTNGCSS